MEWKKKRISQQLRVDPLSGSVGAALSAFTEALSKANRDYLAYGHAVDIINEFGHPSHQWPDTLFDRLRSEGVLTVGQAWDRNKDEPIQVVRFTFQQFADYRVVSEWFKPLHGDPIQLEEALSPSSPLLEQILKAPAGWLEALAVLIPEQFSVELLDAAEWQLEPFERYPVGSSTNQKHRDAQPVIGNGPVPGTLKRSTEEPSGLSPFGDRDFVISGCS